MKIPCMPFDEHSGLFYDLQSKWSYLMHHMISLKKIKPVNYKLPLQIMLKI